MITLEQLVKDYEKKLNEIYAGANTKSKKKRLVNELILFSDICTKYFGVEKSYDWERDYSLISLIDDFNEPFIRNTLENANIFRNIFNSVLNTFIESNYSFYDDYGKCYYRLTDLQLQEIIFTFLNSYDPKLLEDFKNMLNSGNVLETGLYDETRGFTCSFGNLNRNLIFFTSVGGTSIDTASTIVHEYGHHYEMKNFYGVGGVNYIQKHLPLPYYEISSRFFEYAFLNYLKENNLYVDDVNKRLGLYYEDLLVRAFDINLLYQMSLIEIDELDNVFIKEENITAISKEIQEKLNYYYLPSEQGDVVKYRNSFVYGIGSLCAIYLYENYKLDPNNFRKEFRNALLTYPYIKNLSAFESVGITYEKLMSGDTLRKLLKK